MSNYSFVASIIYPLENNVKGVYQVFFINGFYVIKVSNLSLSNAIINLNAPDAGWEAK